MKMFPAMQAGLSFPAAITGSYQWTGILLLLLLAGLFYGISAAAKGRRRVLKEQEQKLKEQDGEAR